MDRTCFKKSYINVNKDKIDINNNKKEKREGKFLINVCRHSLFSFAEILKIRVRDIQKLNSKSCF